MSVSWALFMVVGAIAAQAGDPAAAPSAPLPAPAPGLIGLAAGTPIELEIAEPLSSKTSKIDAMFAIRVLSPVMAEGKVVIPAGTPGQGQVVHAAKATGLGKAGELILAARFLDCGGTRIALRGFRLGGAGRDHAGKLIAATAVGGLIAMPLMFVSGGQSIVPAGTHATARLSAAVDLAPAAAGGCVAPPAGAPAVSVQP
ncbi:hypothetical protein [Sphingomonas hylomeconis]|uniref:Uncharacterized protein n=1 Tax=Sphingomonas hylomeconis TaxID=1395958 RepID=A0ABV7SZT8_9SPHN|nr:hypothetical protein [Sphingomonas hylomeconis]